MSSPAYDGKRQPAPSGGWFAGLAAWWNSLTPQYVTAASWRHGATPRSEAHALPAAGSSGAPVGGPGTSPGSSSTPPAAGGTDASSAPSAAQP